MSEQNSKSEKPKDERRYDPELFKKGLRCDLNQYDFLKQCSENGEEGIKRWNEWRSEKQNRHKDIHLEGVSLAEAWRIVKGESKPKPKRKTSGRRKKSSNRSRSRARKNPSRDFGAEFLFI